AMSDCLPKFGPYEDAMSSESTNIFHTRISALVNIHRLLPREIVQDLLGLELPLPSQEGFLRQVIGWREFMHHVHTATDGFRNLPGVDRVPVAEAPGDGGWGAWADDAWSPPAEPFNDGGSTHSALGAQNPVPPAYWGQPSGMKCLDAVVDDVWREAYSHHITRLMVLANLGTLFEVSPRALADWFWVAYIDAFDWVVEPNVMGMGTFGLGELFTTKPYVSGQAYIKKMSNYCNDCALKKVCPVTRLYWAYMSRHRPELDGNHRLRMMMASERKRSDDKKRVDQEVYDYVTSALAAGEPLQAERLKALGA
ncbi:MAG: deoxyribodipyrimidine photolyase, partial [Myxococcota bacterium]